MAEYYKSRHAGLAVKVRSALTTRHPVTGDIIGERPSVWANFGEPTGSVPFRNPLTGESDVLETYQGGLFSLSAAAEENEWDDDVKAMVERRLDKLCVDRPGMCERVDYIVEPAPKPWPNYDQETDVEMVADLAKTLGLVGKAILYERENLARPALLELLDATGVAADIEPAPVPVVAMKAKADPDELKRTIVV